MEKASFSLEKVSNLLLPPHREGEHFSQDIREGPGLPGSRVPPPLGNNEKATDTVAPDAERPEL